MAYRNWAPVVESLLGHLTDAGATITHASDGGPWTSISTTSEALDQLTGVDTAYLRVSFGDELHSTILLVYGDDPADVVSDYFYSNRDIVRLMDGVIDRFSAEWENKPCPTTPAPAPAGNDQ